MVLLGSLLVFLMWFGGKAPARSCDHSLRPCGGGWGWVKSLPMEAGIFSSGCIAVTGEFHWRQVGLARETQGRAGVSAEFWRAAYGASVSVGLKAGVESLGPERKCCPPLVWLGLRGFWVRIPDDLESNGMMWGGGGELSLKKRSDQQFLEGIVDLAEVRVTSSGLGSVVPTQIHLGSARWGSLVYSLPQTVLWGKNRERGAFGGCARHVSSEPGLSFFFLCLSKLWLIYLFI